ncbi:MAG: BON domain-containing protein [Bdellovibrionales bacterium]|nr:BON domain-containing protein [Bdellovibrionales bacterium]
MKHITGIAFAAVLLFASGLAVAQNNEEHSDLWLESKLDTTLALNRYLSLFDIDTDVKNGVAYLSGTVESDVNKDLAGEVARSIDGIRAVENNITVSKEDGMAAKRRMSREDGDRSFSQRIDDLTTTAAVKTELLANANVSGLNIDVDTMNGHVTLKGTVDSKEERALAEQITKNTAGVRDVDNNLKVGS